MGSIEPEQTHAVPVNLRSGVQRCHWIWTWVAGVFWLLVGTAWVGFLNLIGR